MILNSSSFYTAGKKILMEVSRRNVKEKISDNSPNPGLTTEGI
jgi:hypothetical protein